MADPKLQPIVALVGGETLIGREVRDALATAGLPVRVKLIGAGEEPAVGLTVEGGEPVVVSALDEENLTGAAAVMLAGSPSSSRAAFALLEKHSQRPVVIDLAGGLEDRPEARLRAPMIEPAKFAADRNAVHVIAHPAAVAMAMLLSRFEPRRAVIQVLVPASELGHRGVDELQQQVISLLTFKPVPKEVFDEQAGFNLLARYGADAPEDLRNTETRIGRHLTSLMAHFSHNAMPSFRLAQAPVFHGYSLSVWLQLDRRTSVQEISAALASPGIDVRTGDQEPPTNVGAAGQSGIIAGAIENDPNCPEAVWLWAVADNLRLTADNAVAVLRQLLEARAQ